MRFDVIAFDADDTLWHTEYLYRDARDKLAALLADYIDAGTLADRLDRTEIANLGLYGYGVKSFALSMIETVVELTDGQVGGHEIRGTIDIAREMLSAKVRLLDHVEETLSALTPEYELMVITKGDASEQVPKLHRTGLIDDFRYVEVVGTKTVDTYRHLLEKYGLAPERFLMVGNSLKSDILPVLALGGYGVYIASEILWTHEHVEETPNHERYFELDDIGEVPALVRELSAVSNQPSAGDRSRK
ncbi:MAG: HAD family hydrolase [Anaerolineae bacterium]